jgi:lipoprotein-anchoring transpeptidase ErfK/SrfK
MSLLKMTAFAGAAALALGVAVSAGAEELSAPLSQDIQNILDITGSVTPDAQVKASASGVSAPVSVPAATQPSSAPVRKKKTAVAEADDGAVAPYIALDASDRAPESDEHGRVQTADLGGGFIEFLFTGKNQPRQNDASSYQGSGGSYAAPIDPAQGGRLQVAAYGAHQRDDYRPSTRVLDPQYERQQVAYSGPHAPGTIVVDTDSRFLYLVQANGTAIRYGVGVGRPGFEWSGIKAISAKREWPDWTPPPEMLKRRPDLPRHMVGGPDNPLGARALYLGSSLYRIHGSNEPDTIGDAVSSGCIRMRNEDVMDLYTRVKVGTRVVVL